MLIDFSGELVLTEGKVTQLKKHLNLIFLGRIRTMQNCFGALYRLLILPLVNHQWLSRKN